MMDIEATRRLNVARVLGYQDGKAGTRQNWERMGSADEQEQYKLGHRHGREAAGSLGDRIAIRLLPLYGLALVVLLIIAALVR